MSDGPTNDGLAARQSNSLPRWLTRALPFLTWFDDYSRSELMQDALAGLTVALVLVPQSMAYARLAGLPPQYGLYAALFPPCIGALFGSSRHLATGPVAMVSLMTAAALEPLAQAGTQGFVIYACFLALSVGAIQIGLGLLRLGVLVNLVSHPVLVGFTNAAALIIITSQIPTLFGVAAARGEHHYETVLNAVRAAISYTHWPTLAMGGLALGLMISLKRLRPAVPAVLVVAILTMLLSWLVKFENNKVCSVALIESQEVRQEIQKFNNTIADMDFAKSAALDLDRQIREAHGEQDVAAAVRLIQLRYQRAKLDLKLKDLNAEMAQYRANLRNTRFVSSTLADGQPCFCLHHEKCSPECPCHDALWRLKVGTEPLDENAMVFMSGGAVIGGIPTGLPDPIIPGASIDARLVGDLLIMALIIAVVGFMEAISIAKAVGARTGQRIDPNQELIGQGAANIVGAVFQSFPVSGSFSRTAVNYHAGARSGVASIFTSVIVLCVLLFLTPLLRYMPHSVLAAIIVVAALGLLGAQGFVKAWRIRRDDAVVAVVTFIVTLIVAPHLEMGIAVGVLLSLALLVFRQMKPRVAILSKFVDGSFRDSERHGLERCKHILVVRFYGALFFVNAIHLEQRLLEEIGHMPKAKHIILVANGMNDMDVAGEEVLSALFRKIRYDGYEIYVTGANDVLLELIRRSRLLDVIGECNLFPNVATAVEAIRRKAGCDIAGLCPVGQCPLTSVRIACAASSVLKTASATECEEPELEGDSAAADQPMRRNHRDHEDRRAL